jgi:peptide chain release factor 3
MSFKGIPSFSPNTLDTLIMLILKAKQLDKGLIQLMDEGVAQLFTQK